MTFHTAGQPVAIAVKLDRGGLSSTEEAQLP
jgi:hypothetical protein